jgi:hypothetical protein
MPTPLNASAFAKPHWLLMAKGFKLDDWFNAKGSGSAVERNGGIENPWPAHLRVGDTYYRFADLTKPRPMQIGGAWWLDFAQLTKIMEACPSRGLNLSQMARMFLAVPWEWNTADAMVTAKLTRPMDAYEGKGRPVRQGKAYKTYSGTAPVDAGQDYPGNPNTLQMFVPDMRSHWEQCLAEVKVQEVRLFAKKYRDIIRV